MSKIKIFQTGQGNLSPSITNEDSFCTQYYDTPYLITNDKTILYTDGLGPCVSLAVSAKDNTGICHRIICHCPYAPAVAYSNLEGRIEEYLKSIDNIVELRAVIASFDTFFESEIRDFDHERDTLILNRINTLFSFWKEKHPDFEIPIIQSSYLGINPSGEFVGLSPETVYEEYIKERSGPSSNTKYNEEDLTVSIVLERMHQYIQNKNGNIGSKRI